jgi:biopolymer transport protein ExbD
MALRRKHASHALNEPPQVMLTDIAFNLLIFFVVIASTAPEDGRKQNIPRSEANAKTTNQTSQNIEVAITKGATTVNGAEVASSELMTRLKTMLSGKSRPEDRVVLVKSTPDTSYEHWIDITGVVEEAGGVVTLQMEENKTVNVR